MRQPTSKDPLHGITLQAMLTELVEQLGWDEMGRRVKIKCFTNDPSINSSLKFLRRTPWARQKVEALFLKTRRPNSGIWKAATRTRRNSS